MPCICTICIVLKQKDLILSTAKCIDKFDFMQYTIAIVKRKAKQKKKPPDFLKTS